jgi:hypothetical protein
MLDDPSTLPVLDRIGSEPNHCPMAPSKSLDVSRAIVN